MTSQTGYQTIAIHIFTDISRSKDNQATKFGQLICITWETIFLKNHTQNVVGKLFPGPFLKNQNSTHLWINILKFYIYIFTCLSI